MSHFSWSDCANFSDMLIMGEKWINNEIHEFPGWNPYSTLHNLANESQLIIDYLKKINTKMLTYISQPGLADHDINDNDINDIIEHRQRASVSGYMHRIDAEKLYDRLEKYDDIMIAISGLNFERYNKITEEELMTAPFVNNMLMEEKINRVMKISKFFVEYNLSHCKADFEKLDILLGENNQEIINEMSKAKTHIEYSMAFKKYIGNILLTFFGNGHNFHRMVKKAGDVGINEELYQRLKDDIVTVHIMDMQWARNDYLWGKIIYGLFDE